MHCHKCGLEMPPGSLFCTNCGHVLSHDIETKKSISSKRTSWGKDVLTAVLITIVVLFFIAVLVGLEEEKKSGPINQNSVPDNFGSGVGLDNNLSANSPNETADSVNIESAIVNVYCIKLGSEDFSPENLKGGSGTILIPDGLIITNAHIIPGAEGSAALPETGCLVVLAESQTGQPNEIYLAKPIILPSVSTTYDLAFLSIVSAYKDEQGITHGEYPRKFPNIESDFDRCSQKKPKLGDPIKIFGYPSVSGGTTLTVTEGVISSFPENDIILTSAKVNPGNSGGLAVDYSGCPVGVPSAFLKGESENLGVIIPMSKVSDFISAANILLKQYLK